MDTETFYARAALLGVSPNDVLVLPDPDRVACAASGTVVIEATRTGAAARVSGTAERTEHADVASALDHVWNSLQRCRNRSRFSLTAA